MIRSGFVREPRDPFEQPVSEARIGLPFCPGSFDTLFRKKGAEMVQLVFYASVSVLLLLILPSFKAPGSTTNTISH